MSFRGRGRGRGRGGFGGGGFSGGRQLPFVLFPEIEGLGTAEYSAANIQLIKWSAGLQKYSSTSPYYYEDRSERSDMHKPDIERYSDRKSQAKNVKPPLWHFIKLDTDHMPAELARGEKRGRPVAKRVRWTAESDSQKMDLFEKLEKKYEGKEGTEKKENEEEEEEEGANEEEEGEFSDEGDYEQPEYFDDDEDDYNMAEEGNDEPFY